jgi:hypothetical protein
VKPAAAAPAIVGNASAARATGLDQAAATPTAANAARPTMPARTRRMDATPSATEVIARTTPIPTRRTGLSFDPNVRIAQALSHSGVASIAA